MVFLPQPGLQHHGEIFMLFWLTWYAPKLRNTLSQLSLARDFIIAHISAQPLSGQDLS